MFFLFDFLPVLSFFSLVKYQNYFFLKNLVFNFVQPSSASAGCCCFISGAHNRSLVHPSVSLRISGFKVSSRLGLKQKNKSRLLQVEMPIHFWNCLDVHFLFPWSPTQLEIPFYLSLHHERRKMNFIFPCKISFHHQHANDNENEIYTFFLSPNYYDYLKKNNEKQKKKQFLFLFSPSNDIITQVAPSISSPTRQTAKSFTVPCTPACGPSLDFRSSASWSLYSPECSSTNSSGKFLDIIAK